MSQRYSAREHYLFPDCWVVVEHRPEVDYPKAGERVAQFFGDKAEHHARAHVDGLNQALPLAPARERITTTTIVLEAVEGDFGVSKFVVEAFNEEGYKLKVGDYSQATYMVGEGVTEFSAAELAMSRARGELGRYAPRVEVVQSQRGPAPKTQED